jgi:alpha-ketoglutarate-dependent taurine dioxygenase
MAEGVADIMHYRIEDLGKGVTVPCIDLDLTGSADAPARRELAASLYEVVDREGGLLIRRTGIQDTGQFGAFLASIDFRHHSYVGGTTPRSSRGNGVYTATELPPAFTLHSHQEMSYLDSVPDYVSFYCERPPDYGQKTNLFVDMRAFTAHLPAEFAERYRGQRARLQRTLASNDPGPADPGRKYWQDALGTADRGEAEAIALDHGWDLTWRLDGSLTILQEPARFFRPHPLHGELWCTQAMLFHPVTRLRGAQDDGRLEDVARVERQLADAPDSLDQMFMEDGSRVPDADAHLWFDLMMEHETRFALQRGDVLVLDNMLIGHGRSSFEGPRKMYAALGSRQAA